MNILHLWSNICYMSMKICNYKSVRKHDITQVHFGCLCFVTLGVFHVLCLHSLAYRFAQRKTNLKIKFTECNSLLESRKISEKPPEAFRVASRQLSSVLHLARSTDEFFLRNLSHRFHVASALLTYWRCVCCGAGLCVRRSGVIVQRCLPPTLLDSHASLTHSSAGSIDY